MIRLNCEALTNLTHRVIPFMRRGSRIIQLASSAAFVPQPDFAVYAASKAYVLSFSRAIGKELSDQGIYVTAVCPGPVRTPFFDIAKKPAPPCHQEVYLRLTQTGGGIGIKGFLPPPRHVCVQHSHKGLPGTYKVCAP